MSGNCCLNFIFWKFLEHSALAQQYSFIFCECYCGLLRLQSVYFEERLEDEATHHFYCNENTLLQCGNLKIFLSLTFYVKSILVNLEVQKLIKLRDSFWDFKITRIDFMKNLSDKKILKFSYCAHLLNKDHDFWVSFKR